MGIACFSCLVEQAARASGFAFPAPFSCEESNAVHVLGWGMEPYVTVVERAFQLAKTGKYASVGSIKLQLRDEGYSPHQIEGRVLQRQLAEIIRANSPKS